VEVGKDVCKTVYKGCANDGGRQDVLPGHKLVKDIEVWDNIASTL
jgi:hypothetical protein